jgi:3-hydroxyacyl-CoA dehydrogenase
MTQLEISVIGLGYIGLPTAAVFASRKLRVTGIDINPETVSTINRGLVHIVEPDLDQLVQQSAQMRLENALPSSWLQKSRLLGDVNEDTLFKCSMTVATSQLHSCCLPVLLFSDGTVCIR